MTGPAGRHGARHGGWGENGCKLMAHFHRHRADRTGFWNDPVFQDLGTEKTMFHIDPNLYLGTLF